MLAEKAGIDVPHIISARKYTAEKNAAALAQLAEADLADSVSVCVFGSWAREELTSESDHDWAILTREPLSNEDPDVLKAMQAAERLLDSEGHAPGSTATFGVPFDIHTLRHFIGLDEDTNRNLTRRMLLLLESRALCGEVHAKGWPTVLERYLNYGIKDYRPPRFLLNDLTRYWRTICVDFEGKDPDGEGKDPKWVSRNAKLRTSRKLLFAGGLIPILLCHLHDTDTMGAFLTRWLTATPLDRLSAGYLWADAVSEGARALGAYDRWLGIQRDPDAREHLRTLTQLNRRNSELFAEITDLGRQLERAMLSLLLDSPLAPLARQYVIF